MKISIQSLGTLGDVVPYLGLAQGLIAAGHEVSFLSTEEFTGIITEHGISTPPPIPVKITEWMIEAEERGTLSNPLTFLRDWKRMVKPTIDGAFHASFFAAKGADLVISNLAVTPRAAAEIHKIPLIFASQQPVLANTGQVPCALVTGRNLGQLGNRTTYLARTLLEIVANASVMKHRRNAGLSRNIFPSMRSHLGKPLPLITTIARPLIDSPPTDWHANNYLTNYWRAALNQNWACPPELSAFFQSGPPPIYVGLGSMTLKKPEIFANAVLKALKKSGNRALLSTKHFASFLPDDSPHMLCDFAPHDQIFPHCASIIHHGGAGTTTSALASGRPQGIIPHFLDQFWHARHMNALGLVPKFASTLKITPQKVEKMLHHLKDPNSIQIAKSAQTKLNSQNGVERAINIIERHVSDFSSDLSNHR